MGDLAFLLGLAGVCACWRGARPSGGTGSRFFFLVFMVPLPVALYARIASPLQLLVSQVASIVLNATGVPVLCEGNMMTLPGDVQMFVAEACSGMRQLTGFLALTTAVAYLARGPAWYRRRWSSPRDPDRDDGQRGPVILTGYIMYFSTREYASGAFHTVEGLLMMGLGLSLLRAECWVLDRTAPTAGGADRPPGDLCRAPTIRDRRRGRRPPRPERSAMSPVRRVRSAACFLTVGLRRAGRPGAGDRDRAAAARAPAGHDPASSSATGSGATCRSTRRSSSESQADDYLNRVYESRKRPGPPAQALDQLLAARA